MLRLDFGSDTNSVPSIVDLGNFGILNSPGALDLVKEGGIWYLFVVNVFQNGLTRITFGNGLRSAPTGTNNLGNLLGGLNTPIGIKAAVSGSLKYLLVSNLGNNQVSVFDFSSSFSNTPGSFNSISSPLFSDIWGIDVISDGANWNAFLGANGGGGKLLQLNFGTNLMSTPTITNIGIVPNATEVKIAKEGLDFVALARSRNSGVYRFSFGNNLLQAPVIDQLPSQLLAESRSLEIIKETPRWKAFTIESLTGKMLMLDFVGNCVSEISINNSTTEAPLDLAYGTPGDYYIELAAFDENNIVNTVGRSLTVSSSISPTISAVVDANICLNVMNTFQVNSSDALASVAWDFGDTFTASTNPATHTFSSTGSYSVVAVATGSNGCRNIKSFVHKIYNSPTASFDSPSGLICTNNEFTFFNSTSDNFDGNLSYEWRVDGTLKSTARDLQYAFTSQSDQVVKLITFIPGCSDEESQTVQNIKSGPTVGFTITGQCEDESIGFLNSSSGDIDHYVWDFGNGASSSATNPTQVYSEYGDYLVSLETVGTNDCVSTLSKNLTIYSLPAPDFYIELPPFSCSGTPSLFANTTSNPTDSNVSSWVWNFGDKNNGSSSDKNPSYTFLEAGEYDVELTAVSNFNCAAEITKTITIAQGPHANFTHTPACLNEGTRFTDDSGGDIKSWFWIIGNSTYAFSNPTHVFNSTGDQNVRLTVTGNNNCIATLAKTINVPVPPVLDFIYSNTCEGQPATFQDTSPVAVDPVASQSWNFAGVTKDGSPVQHTFSTKGTYAVKMTSTQLSGCAYSISKNVVISPSPVAKFSANPEWGTPPLNVQFTNQSTGATTYLWRFNDKNQSSSTAVSPNFQFTDLGDYVVDLVATNAQGCSNATSSKISVIVPSLDLELTDLNLIQDPATGAYRIMVTIKNRSNFVLNSADVIVDISGNARIKETITTTILPDGEVSQLLVNQILPGSLLTYLCAELDVANDLDEFNNKKCEPINNETVIFYPYPNPNNGEFRFDWISLEVGEVHFSILNSTGQVVFQQDTSTTSSGLNQALFDLKSYNTGTYFFKFSSGSGSKTIPIIIVR
ncbi:MAG TPA: PKD domain-containing protein [Cyclobacteriaceae bacterium]